MNLTIANPMNFRMVNQLNKAQKNLQATHQEVASGRRTMRPSEQIRLSKVEAQMRGNSIAQRNIQDGMSLAQYTESIVGHVSDMGQRLRELSVQHASDTLNNEDRNMLEMEVKALTDEMSRVISNSKFNDKTVFDYPQFSIQTGANTGDAYLLKMPELKKPVSLAYAIERGTPKEEIKAQSYEKNSYSIETPFYYNNNGRNEKIKATLLVIGKEGHMSHELTMKMGNETYTGKLDFTDLEQGKWDISVNGQKFFGSFTTSDQSTMKDMRGAVKFTLNSVYGNTSFTATSTLVQTEKVVEQIRVPVEPVNSASKTFTMSKLSEVDVEKLLDTDFIDDYILKPLSESRSILGIQQTILERKLDLESIRENEHQEQFSQIRDIDFAKAVMEQTKQEMLVNINATLHAQSMNFNRTLIMELLR